MIGKSVAERNPCPICGRIPHNLPWTLVPGGKKDQRYLVCWADQIALRRGLDEEWKPLPNVDPLEHSRVWVKRSDVHWTTRVGGKHLDYWPTKRKWRYDNKTMTGDVEAFIASIEE